MASYEYYFIFLKLFVLSVADMKILITAAVDFELAPARRFADRVEAVLVATGMGAAATRRALSPLLAGGGFDLALDIGIAGSYRPQLSIGSVVQVIRERHGDAGGALLTNPAPPPALAFLPQATGNTVQQLDERWRTVEADVESMEGAAFFECCLAAGIPFAEVRAVSNFVGEKDHANWDIALALAKLENALEKFFER